MTQQKFLKTILLSSVLLLGMASARAQFMEKIYLRDSVTVHEGWVVEQVPQEYLKILRSRQRDTLTIPVADIWKIVRVMDGPLVPGTVDMVANLRPAKKGRSQAVYLELFGYGGAYSLNYDLRFLKGSTQGFGGRIGLEYIGFESTSAQTLIKEKYRALGIPFGINYLVGEGKRKLELGLGGTYLHYTMNGRSVSLPEPSEGSVFAFSERNENFLCFAEISYRVQSYGKGTFFKAGLTPMIYPVPVPYFNVSFGVHLQRD